MRNLSLFATDGFGGVPQRSIKCIIVDRLGTLTVFVV